jgi:hypothetical protein
MLKHLTVVAGALSAALALSPAAKAADPDPRNWEAVLEEAGPDRVFQRMGRLGKHQQLHRLGWQDAEGAFRRRGWFT